MATGAANPNAAHTAITSAAYSPIVHRSHDEAPELDPHPTRSIAVTRNRDRSSRSTNGSHAL